jgi:Fur family transcriptional regulator, ferric uptake regulator
MRLSLNPGARRTRSALQRFRAFLGDRALRLTPARAAILEAALARGGHFSMEALVEDLKMRGIRGSKATVYRTLPLLTEAGILQEAVVTPESRSYEAVSGARHHDHLVCRACGLVVEFRDEAIEVLQREVASRHGFALDAHHLQLVGRCPGCARKPRGPAGAGKG